MRSRIVVLGAGFGGLEVATILSEELGEEADVTVIERREGFVFGFSKLELMFGRATVDEVRIPFADFAKPGVDLVPETVTAIDPRRREVITDVAVHEADFLVIALGADYDLDQTPGLAAAGHEFYSEAGAARLAAVLSDFPSGRVTIGISAAPYKCPPAPSEAALLLDEYLRERGVREGSEISLVLPFEVPVPPSPAASRALLEAFDERGIELVPGRSVASLDPDGGVAVLDDGSEIPHDLYLGVPKHRAPEAVIASGIAEDDYVPVDPETLETAHPGVYAVGDVAALGVPKAGVFAENAARVVAAALLAAVRGDEPPAPFAPRGACYVQFTAGRVGRVDVDFSGPRPADTFHPPSAALAADKRRFSADRRRRWFAR